MQVPFGSDHGPALTASGLSLNWLVGLRWITVAAQASAVVVSNQLLPGELPVAALLGMVGLEALSNLALMLRLRQPKPLHPALPGLVLGLDILLLTGLLYASGGAANPFTAIYLVHITLAAVVLRGLWAWGLGLLSSLGFGLLFFWNVHVHSLAHMDHGQGGGLSLHLVGMWVAFAITAALIVAFVGRVTEALRQREEELAALKDLSARQSRLAALTTLAAGVAHELGSPLGTIAVAARELMHSAGELGPAGSELSQDAALIRQEVDRCRRILDQLAEPSGSMPGEACQPILWLELEAACTAELAPEDCARLAFDWPSGDCGTLPKRGLVRALKALLANALEATAPPSPVRVRARQPLDTWSLTVEDHGAGMSAEVLKHAGEPFFTTKAPGQGMGLGLFLARTFAEQLGGEVQIHSVAGQGTRVTLTWPGDAVHG